MMRPYLLVGSLIIMILFLHFLISCNNNPDSKKSAGKLAGDSLEILIKRGEYLANYVAVCLDCHSKRDFTKFSLPPIKSLAGSGSNFPLGTDLGVGEVWAPNLTPHHLGDWTDEDIIHAMTRGINKKGDTLFVMMPFRNYSHMALEDIKAIIAYLRTLPTSDSTVPPRLLNVPISAFGPLPDNNIQLNKIPDQADQVNYGKYLTTIASCGDCHNPYKADGTPDFENAFAGGFEFRTPLFTVKAANITPDTATGIGLWSENAFLSKFRANSSDEMVQSNPGKSNTIMPWALYGKMEETDLKAIYAYLRSLPPVVNKVQKWDQ